MAFSRMMLAPRSLLTNRIELSGPLLSFHTRRIELSGPLRSFHTHPNLARSFHARLGSHQSSLEETFSNLPREHDFFNYTSGRFVFNETIRLKERHLVFNVPALCQTIARACNQSHAELSTLIKLAEGGSYRIFEATFQNGVEVIARLPFPSTLPKRYGVSSEVATMLFLKSHGLPTPRIYDWSAQDDNPVGSEYMIMEKARGKDLHETWYSMSIGERLDMVEQIVCLEKQLFEISMPASGGIYLKESLPHGIRTVDFPGDRDGKRFCIGPSTELLWWYANRAELGINGGPWNDSADVLKSLGQRELRWLQKHGQPRLPQNTIYREMYEDKEVTPEVQIQALQDYLRIAEFLVPDDEEINRPTIRHPDLSPNNIFVEDGKITALIDWQHCTSLPLFMQAHIPSHFENLGDPASENFQPPELPADFATLSDGEKEAEEERYRRRQLHYFYVGATSKENPRHSAALWFDIYARRMKLIQKARSPWEGDNTSLKATLIQTLRKWPEILSAKRNVDPSTPPPISYPEPEASECLAMAARQNKADGNLALLTNYLGILNVDGWVPNENYEVIKKAAEDVMVEMMADEDEDTIRQAKANWPFQDHEEIP